MFGFGSSSSTVNFTMVIHPDNYPRNKVYEMNGDIERESGESMDDVQEKIIDWYLKQEGGNRDGISVLSFRYW